MKIITLSLAFIFSTACLAQIGDTPAESSARLGVTGTPLQEYKDPLPNTQAISYDCGNNVNLVEIYLEGRCEHMIFLRPKSLKYTQQDLDKIKQTFIPEQTHRSYAYDNSNPLASYVYQYENCTLSAPNDFSHISIKSNKYSASIQKKILEKSTSNTQTKIEPKESKRMQPESSLIPTVIYLTLLATCAIIFLYFLAANSRKNSEAEGKRNADKLKSILDSANRYTEYANQTKKLVEFPTAMLLGKGELCHWNENVHLYEPRAVRHYQSGNAGIRIAKGVRIGASRGFSYSKDEITHISTGTLCVTNKRLIFDGDTHDRAIPLKKITSIKCTTEHVEIAVDGRQKSLLFVCGNPLLLELVIRACAQSDDTQNLTFELKAVAE